MSGACGAWYRVALQTGRGHLRVKCLQQAHRMLESKSFSRALFKLLSSNRAHNPESTQSPVHFPAHGALQAYDF